MSRTLGKNPMQFKSPEAYMRLIRQFPLRPILEEADYNAAATVMDKLVIRGENDLDQGELDYLAVLTDLIEAYDDRRYPDAVGHAACSRKTEVAGGRPGDDRRRPGANTPCEPLAGVTGS